MISYTEDVYLWWVLGPGKFTLSNFCAFENIDFGNPLKFSLPKGDTDYENLISFVEMMIYLSVYLKNAPTLKIWASTF